MCILSMFVLIILDYSILKVPKITYEGYCKKLSIYLKAYLSK